MTQREKLTIPFDDDSLDAILERPQAGERESVVLLAHGAGANMSSEFMESMSTLLVERGFAVLRFDYPYMKRARELGRRQPPNRRDMLERAHRAAIGELAKRAPDRRILLAGKSMGGRMGSYLAAEDTDGGLAAGLIFLGYPLHPRKQPEKLRCDHFPILAVPALFLQGTRDDLCDLALLEKALASYAGSVSLEIIEAADHGFDVLKRSGREPDEVRLELIDAIDRWERETFPESP